VDIEQVPLVVPDLPRGMQDVSLPLAEEDRDAVLDLGGGGVFPLLELDDDRFGLVVFVPAGE